MPASHTFSPENIFKMTETLPALGGAAPVQLDACMRFGYMFIKFICIFDNILHTCLKAMFKLFDSLDMCGRPSRRQRIRTADPTRD